MNQAQFLISIEDAKKFLKANKLFKSDSPKAPGEVSKEFIAASLKKDYQFTYQCALQNFDFNMLLFDDSFFQFQKNDESLRFAFFQRPFKFITKEEFIEGIYDPDELLHLYENYTAEDILGSHELDYDQYLMEQKQIDNPMYVRYDFTSQGYVPLAHAYSHLHIGNFDGLRLPIKLVITPLMFVKFCVKHTYHDLWKKMLLTNAELVTSLQLAKNGCVKLENPYWELIEDHDLFIN